MSNEDKQLPVVVVTQVHPVKPPAQAQEREEAYRRADRGSQPHIHEGSLTKGGRRV